MQRADKRKFHYIYKITRNDGRYYIGMHSTDDLEDGYFGSGKKITRSIKKHGKEKHSKEILEFLPSRDELKTREEELITEEMRGDPLCMNLAPGGGGGFISEEHQAKAQFAANHFSKRTKQSNSAAAKKSVKTRRERNTTNWFGNNHATFTGRKHSDQSKQKMKDSHAGKQLGEKNSQFGTCWVTKDSKPMKIKKENLEAYLENGYSRGRLTH